MQKGHETIAFLLVTLPNIHRLQKNFSHRLSNELFLIWLLTTPPHLKYAATLPCNLSLMACFDDINVSQGCVATYARCGGIFDIHLTTTLQRNLPVKNLAYRLTFSRFFGPPCMWCFNFQLWAEQMTHFTGYSLLLFPPVEQRLLLLLLCA